MLVQPCDVNLLYFLIIFSSTLTTVEPLWVTKNVRNSTVHCFVGYTTNIFVTNWASHTFKESLRCMVCRSQLHIQRCTIATTILFDFHILINIREPISHHISGCDGRYHFPKLLVWPGQNFSAICTELSGSSTVTLWP